MSKVCTKCKSILPLEAFWRESKAKDGHRSQCRTCRNMSSAAYDAVHPGKLAARKKRYCAAHKEQISANEKRYRDANREHIAPRRQIYRDAHKEQKAAWQRDNPDKRAASKAKRRALKHGGMVEPLPSNYERGLYEAQHGLCFYCGGILEKAGHHRDHMTPLVREGSHSLANLCLACPTCNLRKGTKTAEEFFAVCKEATHDE